MSENIRPWPWRIRGWAGEHDESGAYIEDAEGKHVASTYGGLREMSPAAEWEIYHDTASFIATAPTIVADLRRQLEEAEAALTAERKRSKVLAEALWRWRDYEELDTGEYLQKYRVLLSAPPQRRWILHNMVTPALAEYEKEATG